MTHPCCTLSSSKQTDDVMILPSLNAVRNSSVLQETYESECLHDVLLLPHGIFPVHGRRDGSTVFRVRLCLSHRLRKGHRNRDHRDESQQPNAPSNPFKKKRGRCRVRASEVLYPQQPTTSNIVVPTKAHQPSRRVPTPASLKCKPRARQVLVTIVMGKHQVIIT